MTFLSIQEPDISKICALCGSESLNEDLVGNKDEIAGSMFEAILDAFDTCLYCGEKFRD